METIFDLMKKKEEEKEILFGSFIDIDGDWNGEMTRDKPSDFSNVVLISEDNIYRYYLAWNSNYELINKTIIYRCRK